jgi:hypothetical protein
VNEYAVEGCVTVIAASLRDTSVSTAPGSLGDVEFR